MPSFALVPTPVGWRGCFPRRLEDNPRPCDSLIGIALIGKRFPFFSFFSGRGPWPTDMHGAPPDDRSGGDAARCSLEQAVVDGLSTSHLALLRGTGVYTGDRKARRFIPVDANAFEYISPGPGPRACHHPASHRLAFTTEPPEARLPAPPPGGSLSATKLIGLAMVLDIAHPVRRAGGPPGLHRHVRLVVSLVHHARAFSHPPERGEGAILRCASH